jgi:DNA-binding NarL/FixJ family response regulator
MSDQPQTLLVVEDNPPDAQLIDAYLKDAAADDFRCDHVWRFTEARDRLQRGGIDIILLDLNLPDSKGLETFQKLRAAAPSLPIVILTGLDDEKLAIKAVEKGAQEYLLKDQLDDSALVRALRYALARKKAGLPLTAQSPKEIDPRGELTESSAIGLERRKAIERLQKLSPRQREVLELYVSGQHPKRIASTIGIRESTVRNHLRTVRERVGAKTIQELVRMATLAGLSRDQDSHRPPTAAK